MQSALRPNNSHEACCCLLAFEPADADDADNSVVPNVASQVVFLQAFSAGAVVHVCLQ